MPDAPSAWGPFTAGELVRRIFALYREHASVVLGIGAVCAGLIFFVQAPLLLLNTLLVGRTATPDVGRVLAAIPVLMLVGLVSILLLCAIYALGGGALMCAALAWRRGESPTVTDALTQSGRRFGTAFGAMLQVALRLFGWYMLCIIPVGIVMGFFGFAAAMHGASSAKAPAFVVSLVLVFLVMALLLLAFLVWQWTRYAMTLGPVFAEGARAGDAVRRAIDLSRRNKGRLLALFGIIFLIGIAEAMVVLPFSLAGALAAMKGQVVHHSAMPQAASSILMLAFSTLVRMFLYIPVGGIGLALCYFDLRARKDAVVPTHMAAPLNTWTPEPEVMRPTQPSAYPPVAPYVDRPRTFHVDPGRAKPAEPASPPETGDDTYE